MATEIPRLVLAGLSGDSGKTIVSYSLLSALRQKGVSVSVFKKGPDYIDAAWLSKASDTRCRNLDTYMVDPAQVRRRFIAHAQSTELAVVEGNRGLFDGRDVQGTHSTAALARLLDAPVVLVVDVTKATRTIAALVRGCMDFDSGIRLAGVILNQVAGRRHRQIISDAIHEYCRIPVLGAVPKLGEASSLIPGRHLGLVTPAEFDGEATLRQRLAAIADEYLDVAALIGIAHSATPMASLEAEVMSPPAAAVRIGYFRDSVFTFYYPENLEALEANGAELVAISSTADPTLPEIDGLYIGGGFPETHADRLCENRSMMEAVRAAVVDGLPVYAECGGLIYLCRSLLWQERTYPMAGVFAVDLRMHDKPVGHGYVSAQVDADNPYYEIGAAVNGHEFHYSGPTVEIPAADSCMKLDTGVGLGGGRDGLVVKNCLACYLHLHADGVPSWARALVWNAASFRAVRQSGLPDGATAHIRICNNTGRRATPGEPAIVGC